MQIYASRTRRVLPEASTLFSECCRRKLSLGISDVSTEKSFSEVANFKHQKGMASKVSCVLWSNMNDLLFSTAGISVKNLSSTKFFLSALVNPKVDHWLGGAATAVLPLTKRMSLFWNQMIVSRSALFLCPSKLFHLPILERFRFDLSSVSPFLLLFTVCFLHDKVFSHNRRSSLLSLLQVICVKS